MLQIGFWKECVGAPPITNLDNLGCCHAAVAWRGSKYIFKPFIFTFASA
jgi:hypothetical protein